MKLKNWILKKKISIIITFIGAIAGFLYWNYVGCASGNCGITANWHTSMAYSSLMGWFVGDIASDKFNPKKNENN
ncbi:MAG: hypothetical protein JKX68_05055 [Flavobacteriales bacterium]|nr:hypothetical protein [Flavobacteriales bacterium]